MITVVGLGPAGLSRVPSPIRDFLLDESRTVIVRTLAHPASEELAALREVVSCDDLYEGEDYDSVYRAIVDRILEAADTGPTVYAVPGSPRVGEFAVRDLIATGTEVELVPGESFVDAVLGAVGYDPLDRGLQILNGHELPDPLILDKPTIIAHLDTPETLAEVAALVSRVIPEGAEVLVLQGAGDHSPVRVEVSPEGIDPDLAGNRTSMFIDVEAGGLVGAIKAMRRLREECPWDREQTHQSLVKYLIEEVYELIEAVAGLPDAGSEPDWATYARVEDELGDVLLIVLFHEAIARQAGAFDINDTAEVLRQKLVRRHPHIFGDAVVGSPGEVKSQWDRIKADERGDRPDASALDGVPAGMPALQRAAKVQNRAAKVGFDWDAAPPVLDKVVEELGELADALAVGGDVEAEFGDVLFSVVNLSRHLGVDSEIALGRAIDRFGERFRMMEREGPLEGFGLDELNRLWERAKTT